jgi:NAD(P)-dependent dehydrogenase (short-subunit alcohol dehydrogenase family)
MGSQAMRLAGKRALVTGAGTGIGREVALELARQGADVVLSYYGSQDTAMSAVDAIRGLGRRSTAFQSDLAQVEECLALVDGAVDHLDGLDILVNNAGITRTGDFFGVSPDDFAALYDLNIRGQYFCAQQAAKTMRQHGGGVIINMLSIHAMAALPRSTVYEGTKGAIQAWTRGLAIDLAPYHIRVVGIAPGAIEVPRYYQNGNYSPDAMASEIPWGRVGQPTDVAKLCAFLASDDADFIVGTTIVVDGGTTARMALNMH